MSGGIAVDYESQLCEEVRKWLPYDQSDHATVAKLHEMRSGDLLILLINWLERLVHPHPRKTFYSREILSNPLYTSHFADLGMIALLSEKGDDLSPHLSRGVKNGFAPVAPEIPKALTSRKDLDMLLNDWGIHHLHLSGKMEADGFVKRGKLLLFAIFGHDAAYFLDLLPHSEWTNQHLVEVAIRNWPEDELFLTLNGIKSGRMISADDRKVLRNKGISSMVEVDGKVFVSRTTGITTAGTSNRATMKAIRLRRELDHAFKQLALDRNYLRRHVEEVGKVYPDEPQFRVIFFRNAVGFWFGIKEEISGTVIPVAW